MALDQPSLPSNPNTNSGDGNGNGNGTPPSSTVNGGEDGKPTARLPRWTRQEILVLIQGKSDAESRFKPGRNGSGFGSSEPKWALVSSYCKKHGVNRGPIQCRKRWSNLAGDYKKIKEWETQVRDETESFWLMRNDLRRERKLPGYFDREVYDILDSPSVAVAAAAAAAATVLPVAVSVSEAVGDEEVHIYDSNRKVSGEDGLFSDFEKDEILVSSKDVHVPSPVPISEKQFLPLLSRCQGEGNAQGTNNEKQPASNPEMGSTSQGERKRKRFPTDEEDESLQSQLIDVLEKNGKMLSEQLEAQNMNFQLDRQHQNDTASNIVAVLDKLANALGRIADKL
ncbi:trihelix transcription factor ASR3 isoform X1 [Vicia villosa]|uniref:trihelix transcription factor ASR3 isoform X1 n=1 Tax=Vicia villosa TaxID=3911 RepID=UPI00273BB43C|nr:trihelix transcription factor ASR3 isoform X1 [Vicia villosa]